MGAEVCWAGYSPLEATIIERGKKEIVVEYVDDGYMYTIVLSSQDGCLFEGNYESVLKDQSRRGYVTCSKYLNDNGFALHGIMVEDGWEYHWWTKKTKH